MILSLWTAFLRLPRGWHYVAAGVLAVAALASLWLWLDAREKADDRRNQEIGATVEREKSATATIKQVEKANAARDEVRNDIGSARYDQCLRTARTPALCERFLPQRQADQR